MIKFSKIEKEKWITEILIKINPELKNFIKKKKFDFIDSGLIDSLMIIKLLFEIEKKNKKRINASKIKPESFRDINNIIKLLK